VDGSVAPPSVIQDQDAAPVAATRPEDGEFAQAGIAEIAGTAAPAMAATAGLDRAAQLPARTNGHGNGGPAGQANGQANGQERGNGCTAPQLRRFIKSRPYVPMHELRRRFAIDGGDDDVTQVAIAQGHVYVGLPSREGSLLGELLRGGEIGYELSLDPRTPVVVGVYPMRPVPRS
jgi:hypothetical protein